MADSVRDIDKGWKRILRKLGKVDGSYTKVGIPQGAPVASPTSTGSNHKPITQTSELVKIAAVQEFGTKKAGKNHNIVIPQRPAMRQAFDENLSDLNTKKELLYSGVVSGKIDEKQALGLLGEYVTSKIKRQITKLSSPRNADSTRKRKKSGNPLIDRGQYRNSITHVEVMT